MAITLYDISIASSLQVVGAVQHFLKKGKEHLDGKGESLDEIVAFRLFDDMLPFSFQLVSVCHHSLGSIKGVEAGVFSPPGPVGELSYEGFQGLIDETLEGLSSFSADQVNALAGNEVIFSIGDRKIPFTAENFVMSFSQPNLYFHAATAYDILRIKGVPLGKRDFMGALRMKT